MCSYVKLFTGLLILQVTNSKRSISLDRNWNAAIRIRGGNGNNKTFPSPLRIGVGLGRLASLQLPETIDNYLMRLDFRKMTLYIG